MEPVTLSDTHSIPFTKMHGIGNDYVYVNCFEHPIEDASRLSRAISDRHRGVGSDGLILICPSDHADVRMEMYNADGSRAEMCGNGIRCVAKYAYEHGLAGRSPMRVETDSGVLTLDIAVESGVVTAVRVDMGPPSLAPADLPADFPAGELVEADLDVDGRTYLFTGVSMGNPHAVIFVDNVERVALAVEGPAIECHSKFPNRINVHFVNILARDEARMITWERGSGPTLACGTGACAVAVAGVKTNRLERSSVINLPGGALNIDWPAGGHVFMTGPAETVFEGVWRG